MLQEQTEQSSRASRRQHNLPLLCSFFLHYNFSHVVESSSPACKTDEKVEITTGHPLKQADGQSGSIMKETFVLYFQKKGVAFWQGTENAGSQTKLYNTRCWVQNRNFSKLHHFWQVAVHIIQCWIQIWLHSVRACECVRSGGLLCKLCFKFKCPGNMGWIIPGDLP